MTRFRHWLKRRATVLAFLLLALAAAVAINASAKYTARQSAVVVYHSALAICVRQNDLRRATNQFISESDTTRQVVLHFLEGAEAARIANWRATHLQADLLAAQRYAGLANQERYLIYFQLPIIPCDQVVSKP